MRFEVGDRFACLMRLSDGTDTDRRSSVGPLPLKAALGTATRKPGRLVHRFHPER